LDLFNIQGTSSVFNAGFTGINYGGMEECVDVTASIETIAEKLWIHEFEGFPGIKAQSLRTT